MLTDQDRADQLGQATREKLKQFVARIERLEAEKSELAADIREVYAEVKTFGLDTKVMRRVISQRKKEAAERAEMDALEDMYMSVVEDDYVPETPPAPTQLTAIFIDEHGTKSPVVVDRYEPNFNWNGRNWALAPNSTNVYKPT